MIRNLGGSRGCWWVLGVVLLWGGGVGAEEGILVRGVMVGEEGSGVAGVGVELLPVVGAGEEAAIRLGGQMLPEAVDRDRSGADGSYEVRAPGAGMWRLVLRPPGGVPLETRLEPLLDDTVLPKVQRPTARSVEVAVRDSAGRPLAGALVELDLGVGGPWWPWRRQGWLPLERRAFTDAEGLALLPLLAEEAGRLRIWPSASAAETGAEFGFDDTRVEVTVPGPPAPWRIVEVRYPDGEPAPSTLVTVDGSPRPVGRTGPDGRLRVGGLQPGSHSLHLRAEGGWEAVASLSVAAPGEESLPATGSEAGSATSDVPSALPYDAFGRESGAQPVVVSLVPPFDVPARVVDARSGEPVEGALVWPVDVPSATATATAEGRVSVRIPDPDPTGELGEVAAAAFGYRSARRLPSGTAEMLFALDPQPMVEGRVVDPRKEVVAGALVRLRRRDDRNGAWRTSQEEPGTWSRGDGRFRIAGLDRETVYEVRVEAEGYPPVQLVVTPPARETVRLVRGGSVTGRVTDPTGAPLAGVVLRLFEASDAESRTLHLVDGVRSSDLEALSGADGSFELPTVLPGTWELEALAEGRVPADRTGLTVESQVPLDVGTLELEPAAAVHGRVLDPEGEPLAGVRVNLSATSRFDTRRFQRINSFSGMGSDVPDAVTGDDGTFRLLALGPEDPVDLQFAHFRFTDKTLRGVVPSGDPLEVVLEAGVRVTGRVVSADGEPVARQVVVLQVENRTQTSAGGFVSSSSFHEMTGPDGTFESEGLPPGQLTVSVRPGALPGRSEGPFPGASGDEIGPLEITLGEPRTVEGRVLAPDGTEAAGASVRAETPFGHVDGVTDAEGLYRLEGVEAGEVTVIAVSGVARAEVRTVVRGPVEVVDLVLEERPVLAGRVVDGTGEPVLHPQVTVDLEFENGWRRFRADVAPVGALEPQVEGVRVSPDGHFLLLDPAPGLYRVTGRAEGLRGETRIEVGDRPPRDVRVVVEPSARVSGLVVGDDELVASGTLAVSVTRNHVVEAYARVDETGRFHAGGLGPGTWTLQVVGASGPLQEESVAIDRPGETVEVEIDLDDGDRSAALAGRIRVADRPLAAGGVRLLAGDIGQVRWTSTDQAGRYRFDRLVPGRYRVMVTGAFAAPPWLIEMEIVGTETLDLDLQAAALRGRVADEAGRPVAGARVALGQPEAAASSQDTVTATGPEGRFEIPQVLEGIYQLRVSAEGRRADVGPLRLGTADVGGVEVVLQR